MLNADVCKAVCAIKSMCSYQRYHIGSLSMVLSVTLQPGGTQVCDVYTWLSTETPKKDWCYKIVILGVKKVPVIKRKGYFSLQIQSCLGVTSGLNPVSGLKFGSETVINSC